MRITNHVARTIESDWCESLSVWGG